MKDLANYMLKKGFLFPVGMDLIEVFLSKVEILSESCLKSYSIKCAI